MDYSRLKPLEVFEPLPRMRAFERARYCIFGYMRSQNGVFDAYYIASNACLLTGQLYNNRYEISITEA